MEVWCETMGVLADAWNQRSPIFLAPGTGFVEDNFSLARWRGMGDCLKSMPLKSLEFTLHGRVQAPMRI